MNLSYLLIYSSPLLFLSTQIDSSTQIERNLAKLQTFIVPKNVHECIKAQTVLSRKNEFPLGVLGLVQAVVMNSG